MGYLQMMAGTKKWAGALAGYFLLLSAALGGCSSTSQTPKDAGDAGSTDATPSSDGSGDAPLTCTYPDGGAPGDGGTFNSVCPTSGCPGGTVCVVEIGGVAGGGGEYCAPIPSGCHGTPTCACMGGCVCTSSFGVHSEMCSVQNGSIACDNGIR